MTTMLTTKLLVLSMMSGALSAWSATQTASTSLGSWKSIWCGFLAVVAACISILLLWIPTLRPSPQQGVISVLHHLYFAGKSYIRGKVLLRQLRKGWKNPRFTQDQFLMRVLKENKDTEYGRKHKLENIATADEFRQRHPLTTYEHYQPYVERVMAGKIGVMTQVMPNAFVQTSGTTGPSKYFPHKDHRSTEANLLDITFTNLMELRPRLGLLQKWMFQYVQPVMTRAKSGGSIRPALSLYEDGFMASCFASPPAAFRIQTLNDASYIHLLFALLDPNIGVFFGGFSGAVDTLMKQLERWWQDIVYDIEHGTINKKVKFNDADIRSTLENALGGGNPERAGKLRRQFQIGFNGIMKRVWPNLQALIAMDNVGIWPDLKEKYAKGVQFVNFGYGNSEGIFQAISPWFHDDNKSMVFCPNRAFFEFIKLEDSKESQPKTLFIDELKVGKEYELVFTQESGLYRYRVGDVIRITGYHYNCPTFQFMYRMGLILNLRYEKMNQVVLKAGLQSAVRKIDGVTLVEYTVAESTLIPKPSSAFEEIEAMPYYVIFLELDEAGNTDKNKSTRTANMTAKEFITSIDAELRDRNSDYNRLRREGAISDPRVHIVKPGTFEDLKQYVLNTTSTTAIQYKVQHRIRTADTLNFMYGHST